MNDVTSARSTISYNEGDLLSNGVAMASSTPSTTALEALSLPDVLEQCQEAIRRFKRTKDPGTDSQSCAEIIRRAATRDEPALGILVYDISYPRIMEWCRSKFRSFQLSAEDIEDLQQEVARRLVRKFYSDHAPYRPGSLVEYYAMLVVTTRRCILDMREANTYGALGTSDADPSTEVRQGQSGVVQDEARSTKQSEQGRGAHMTERRLSAESLERLYDAGGFEPIEPMFTDEVERRLRFERFLELLVDPRMREVFRRRFGLAETPDDVARALGLTKAEVYKLAERAIRMLSTNPEVRNMLEQ